MVCGTVNGHRENDLLLAGVKIGPKHQDKPEDKPDGKKEDIAQERGIVFEVHKIGGDQGALYRRDGEGRIQSDGMADSGGAETENREDDERCVHRQENAWSGMRDMMTRS